MALEPQDLFCLRAAEGWLELGNPVEALAELEGLTPSSLEQPEVLHMRWQVLAAARRWEEALETAAKLVHVAPEVPLGWVNRSFSLHELKRTAEARDNLLRVVEKFAKDPIIRYNLACYECQLGRLEEAKTWFQKACDVGVPDKLREMALLDTDLVPLRHQRGLGAL